MNINFESKQQFEFDVTVIGSGIAGLTYCLELLKNRPQTKIALLTKQELHDSNSQLAQGGIASVYSSPDSFASHSQDTLKAGAYYGNETIINAIVKNAPAVINLLQEYGISFTNKNNIPDLHLEGGHSYPRIYHVEDTTGAYVIDQLKKNITTHKYITIFENFIAIDLIQDQNNQEIIGVYVLEVKKEQIHRFLSKCIIMATGGAGKIYRYTSNSQVATGDGIAMCYRAGTKVSNMEFYQFHPTLLFHAQKNNFLISEAVRGEGAYLRTPKCEKRFMQNYAPQEMELATRDKVARAIFFEMKNSQSDFVWLDIRHKSKKFLSSRFPNIYYQLQKLGLAMEKDFIPIVPAAHYLCGGIPVDIQGQTHLPRLFVIGETACTDFHGANRLASNSLLEAFVTAHNAAKASLTFVDQKMPIYVTNRNLECLQQKEMNHDKSIDLIIQTKWHTLRHEMSKYAGIIRHEAGLKYLLQQINEHQKFVDHLFKYHKITRNSIELRNITLVAKLITQAALLREESLGCHYREDFPHIKMNNNSYQQEFLC